MKLLKVPIVLLLGVVTLNSSLLAVGTPAGTVIDINPTIKYAMNNRKIEEKAPRARYIVDKVISFEVSRVNNIKQKTVKGLTLLAPFRVSNLGNSTENFVLNLSYGKIRDFSFQKSVIYIDKNGNNKLEKSEEVDASIVKNLTPDSNQMVWLGAVTPKNIGLNKKVSFGLKGEASSGDTNAVYKTATKQNDNSKEDIVFADKRSEDDNIQDNIYINRYVWSIKSNVELGIELETNIISADPLNGVCKNKKDANDGNYFSIPGATNIRSWKIYNNTTVTAKDIKFSMKANLAVEKFATSSRNTWWRSDSRVHVLLSSTGKIIGVGRFNRSNNSIDFTVKEIRGGEMVYPHIVTEIK
jgi:hypothetical protein